MVVVVGVADAHRRGLRGGHVTCRRAGGTIERRETIESDTAVGLKKGLQLRVVVGWREMGDDVEPCVTRIRSYGRKRGDRKTANTTWLTTTRLNTTQPSPATKYFLLHPVHTFSQISRARTSFINSDVPAGRRAPSAPRPQERPLFPHNLKSLAYFPRCTPPLPTPNARTLFPTIALSPTAHLRLRFLAAAFCGLPHRVCLLQLPFPGIGDGFRLP